MGIKVSSTGGRKPFEAITEMIQPGVLADIIDKGDVPNKFKPGSFQHKCTFVWIVAEEDAEGRNKRVFETFTVSLNEKATMRKRLKEFGLTDAKVKALEDANEDIDLDQYLGTQRLLVMNAEDGETPGKVFIKVTATMPLKPGQGVKIPADFVRKQDRTE